MASKHHDDWQSSKKTVLQRNAYMFDNELMSDISFTCGKSSRIFRAHKYVLATSSAVFYAMFYGDLAQKESTIRIMDAEAEGFKEFLRFLYTDECKITAENAAEIMYLAKKYFISSLADKCCKVLEASITHNNVFVVLEQAIQFDEKDLETKCWDIVSKETLECTNSEAFCNVRSHTLNALVKRESLAISEVDLFKAVLRWVDNECERQGVNIGEDVMARRRILGDIIYDIHFLEMSQEDFAKYVPPMEILTDTEIISIFRAFNGVDVPRLKWKDQEKRHFARAVVAYSRFHLSNIVFGWCYPPNSCDALSLTVNKTVLFHGVRLFGNSFCRRYKVQFSIKDKDDSVTGTYISDKDSEGIWGYDVMLPKPVSLLPDEEFSIIATINGQESYKGRNGISSVKVDDVVVTFKDPPSGLSTNCTKKVNGQFYKIYLSSL